METQKKAEEKQAYWNIIDNTLFGAFHTGRTNPDRTFHEWQKDNGVTDSIYNAMEEHFSGYNEAAKRLYTDDEVLAIIEKVNQDTVEREANIYCSNYFEPHNPTTYLKNKV